MSNLVSDSSELITPAHDRFLDGHPTRRELQKAFNKMGNNDAELIGMFDTVYIVTNLICEKLNITKGELDAYVEKKKAEMVAAKTQEQNNDLGRKEGIQPSVPSEQ